LAASAATNDVQGSTLQRSHATTLSGFFQWHRLALHSVVCLIAVQPTVFPHTCRPLQATSPGMLAPVVPCWASARALACAMRESGHGWVCRTKLGQLAGS
jgi:hypothetical protein